MSGRTRTFLVVLGFLALNLAVTAIPAVAGVRYRAALCQTPEGDVEPCCINCFFFCGCDLEEVVQ